MKYLIVGLGNIGPEYADTRHNIGFMILDELAKQENAKFYNMRLAYYTEVNYKARTLYSDKTNLTYMNLSGKAVNHWMKDVGRSPLKMYWWWLMILPCPLALCA